MKCKHCQCPVAVPYVTDTNIFCDSTCSELNKEWKEYMDAQRDLHQVNVAIIPVHLNPVMD